MSKPRDDMENRSWGSLLHWEEVGGSQLLLLVNHGALPVVGAMGPHLLGGEFLGLVTILCLPMSGPAVSNFRGPVE